MSIQQDEMLCQRDMHPRSKKPEEKLQFLNDFAVECREVCRGYGHEFSH